MMHQPDWCSRWALYRPNQVAIEDADSGDTVTYAALNRMGNGLAVWLRDTYAIGKGDRVAVLAEWCVEYIGLFVAAQKSGLILVPLNYRLTPSELAIQIQDAAPTVLFSSPHLTTLAKESAAGSSVKHVLPIADATQITKESRVPVNFPVPESHADDPVLVLYTSGTTGVPKGAIYSKGMLEWNSINTAMSLVINEGSRTVNVMPPFHTGGWNVLLTPFLHHGGYVCLLNKFDADKVLALLMDKAVTIFMGVPTMLRMISESSHFDEASFPDLYYLIVGGEPMPVPLIETWDKKGVAVRQGYGLTEVGPNLTSLHQDDAIRKKGSIGRPNFYVQMRICDAQGQDVAIGERGELWLKGPMTTPGYWRNKEATAAAFEDGWFRTGDVVIQDEEQYLYIVDRLKHMYISGGENVYPAEVERVLIQHPAVAEVAVIAVPDEKWGEVGYAFLRPKDEAIGEEEIKAFCMQKLARYKVPKYLEWVDELPKSDTGKMNKRALIGRAQIRII